MDFIEKPSNKNSQIIKDLAKANIAEMEEVQKKLKSYLPPLYRNYMNKKGNALEIKPELVEKQPLLAEFVNGCYDRNRKEVKYIGEIRLSRKASRCAMCSGLHPFNIEHFLPRSKFPEFAIFTMNLVPACNCNLRRGVKTIDENNGSRILHPYFDEILKNKLIKCRFNLKGSFIDQVEIKENVPFNHEMHKDIKTHIKFVVEESGIKDHVILLWNELKMDPRLMLVDLPKDYEESGTIQDLVLVIKKLIRRTDQVTQSNNNWKSFFLSGLLHDDVLTFLDNYIKNHTTLDLIEIDNT